MVIGQAWLALPCKDIHSCSLCGMGIWVLDLDVQLAGTAHRIFESMEISPMQGSPLGETAAVKGMLARVKCFFVSRTQRFFVFALLYLIINFVATSFLIYVL
jgi:hypothetical protein